MYAPPPNSIFDDKGRVLPEVLAARRRGIWFDFGNGVADHFNWQMVESGDEAGLLARHPLHRLECNVTHHRASSTSRT